MNPKRLFRTHHDGGKGDMPRPHNPATFRANFDLIDWHKSGQLVAQQAVPSEIGPPNKK